MEGEGEGRIGREGTTPNKKLVTGLYQYLRKGSCQSAYTTFWCKYVRSRPKMLSPHISEPLRFSG